MGAIVGKRLFLRILVLALMLGAATYVVVALRQAREDAKRSNCKGRLTQLGLALLYFQEDYGCLPPAQVLDEHGRPMHSWRVLILEIMDHEKLYQRYDFSEPWNGPHSFCWPRSMIRHRPN